MATKLIDEPGVADLVEKKVNAALRSQRAAFVRAAREVTKEHVAAHLENKAFIKPLKEHGRAVLAALQGEAGE